MMPPATSWTTQSSMPVTWKHSTTQVAFLASVLLISPP